VILQDLPEQKHTTLFEFFLSQTECKSLNYAIEQFSKTIKIY